MLHCSSAPASGNLPSSSALLICNPLLIAALTEKFIGMLFLVLILAWTFCHCFQMPWPAVDVCISLWLWQGEESVVLGNWGYIPVAVMFPVHCSTTAALVSRWWSCQSTQTHHYVKKISLQLFIYCLSPTSWCLILYYKDCSQWTKIKQASLRSSLF